jgi:hypothetical protein
MAASGIALAWPFSTARYFAPWTPIPVAPIGARMLTGRSLRVVMVEAVQFTPLLLWAAWPRRRAFVRELGTPELGRTLSAFGLEHNPELLRLFTRAGRALHAARHLR